MPHKPIWHQSLAGDIPALGPLHSGSEVIFEAISNHNNPTSSKSSGEDTRRPMWLEVTNDDKTALSLELSNQVLLGDHSDVGREYILRHPGCRDKHLFWGLHCLVTSKGLPKRTSI
jgi:hypothetical protein